jgi:hypothetical protein
MVILNAVWFRLLAFAQRAYREERGDALINWIVLAIGLAAAAAAVVAIVRPAIETAASHIVKFLTG